jgi:hypothetical protein
VSTQLLAFDVEQHRHPSHTSNGSYPTASVVAAAGSATDRDRYTTLRTGTTYSSDDCRFSSPKLLAPAHQGMDHKLNQEHDPMIANMHGIHRSMDG